MVDFDQVAHRVAPTLGLSQHIASDWPMLSPSDWLDCEESTSSYTASDIFFFSEQVSATRDNEQPWEIIDLPAHLSAERAALRPCGLATSDARGAPYEKQTTTCRFCGLGLLKKTLSRHIERKHFDMPTLQCQMCGKPCSRADILKRHQKLHCTKGNNVECIYCGKRIGIRHLRSHFKTPGCIAARTASTISTNSGVKHMLWHTAKIEITRLFGADSIQDALTACSYLLGTLQRLLASRGDSTRSGIGRSLDLLGSEEPRILSLRGLALSLMRQGAAGGMGDAKSFLTAYMMWTVDSALYGAGADSARVHKWHLAYIVHKNTYTKPATDAYWDQMELYCRAAGEIFNAAADLCTVPVKLSINRALAGEIFGLPRLMTEGLPLLHSHVCTEMSMENYHDCMSLLFAVPAIEETAIPRMIDQSWVKPCFPAQCSCSASSRSMFGHTCTQCPAKLKGPTTPVCFGEYVRSPVC